MANAQNGVYIQANLIDAPDISVAVTFTINSEPETIVTAITDTDGEIDLFFVDLPAGDWSMIQATYVNCIGDIVSATQYNNEPWPLIDIFFELYYCSPNDIYGCTNSSAINYNPFATIDDGSCVFSDPQITVYNDSLGCLATFVLEGVFADPLVEWNFGDGTPILTAPYTVYHNFGQGGVFEVCATFSLFDGTLSEACVSVVIADCQNDIYGCTDSNAINYNPNATIDDGTCYYESDVANDLCENATPLLIGTNVVNNIGAYQNEGIWGECWGFGQGEGEQSSVWYSFTTPEFPATIDITAFTDGTNSLTDTQFGLYQECNGEMIACDGNGGIGLFSAFHFECGDLLEDTDYLLMIDGWNGDMGTCLLDFEMNDDCNPDVLGCTDPLAINYNPLATIDNETCQYSDSCSVYFVTTTNSCNTFILCAYGSNSNILIPGSWTVNGEAYDPWNSIVTFVFDAAGTYEICFEAESDQCASGIFECTSITVDPGCFETCPEMIIESDPNGCGAWHYLTGIDQNEEYLWYFGDGTSEYNVSGVYHEYSGPGYYKTCIAYEPTDYCFAGEICAYVQINACEGEVYGCTDSTAINYNPLATIDDGSCYYIDSCNVFIIQDQIDCNSFVFNAVNDMNDEFVDGYWTVNQELAQEWSPFYTFVAEEPGTYEICFEGYINECETGVFTCHYVFVGPECFDDCPFLEATFADPIGCTGVFQLLNVDPQETVTWYIDSTEPLYASSEVYYDFETNGWHTVCAVYEQEGCDQVEFCTEIYTYGCEPIYGCTDPDAINFNPNANTDDGSCEYITDCEENIVTIIIESQYWGYEISWELVYDGNVVAEGGDYENYSTFSSMHCLSDGCYTLNMFDSYGDGWNGGTYSIQSSGGVLAEGTLASGSEGFAEFGINTDDCNSIVFGCTDPNAINYNPLATIDDGSCDYESDCDGYETVLLINNSSEDMGYWTLSLGDEIVAADSIFTSWNDAYLCLEAGCYTFTLEMAEGTPENTNFFTMWQDQDIMVGNDWMQPGTSTYDISIGNGCDGGNEIYGCMDSLATNYNPQATIDDGSCYYEFDCDVSFTVYPDTTGSNTIWVVPDVNLWNAESVFWDFGDGTTSTELFPEHIYTGDGPYTLCVSVLFSQPNGAFCEVTYCVVITADMLDGAGFQSGFMLNVIENADVLSVDTASIFSNLSLWPNPTKNYLNLKFNTLNASDIKISIMDVSGKMVHQELFGSHVGEMNKEIDIRNLAPGMYLVSLQNEFGIATERFVVSR